MRQRYMLAFPRAQLALGGRTAVMGILNVTPDSFSDGGDYFELEKAIARGKEIEQQGADILDIGGESSRPGAYAVAEEEEVRRVLPVIEALASAVHIPISIDTYRAAVADRAIQAGAQMINDISAFRFDPAMPAVAAKTRAAVVLMHSRGGRDELHSQQPMHAPVPEIMESLSASIEQARSAGVPAEALVVDPGIGFGKTAGESVAVLKSLGAFSKLGCPLLVGTSRKSFIRALTAETLDARQWGTAATVVAAIMRGAHIVRVHDVRTTRVLADVTDRIL